MGLGSPDTTINTGTVVSKDEVVGVGAAGTGKADAGGAGSSASWEMEMGIKFLDEFKKKIRNQACHQGQEVVEGVAAPFTLDLASSLMAVIGDIELLDASPCVYLKVLNTLKFQFSNSGKHGSDLEDMLRYKPVEALGDKVTQILGYICIYDVESANQELATLKEWALLDFVDGIDVIGKILEAFVNWATGKELNVFFGKLADLDILSLKAACNKNKILLKVVQTHIFRNFHYRSSQRITLLNEVVAEDPLTVEWWLTLSDALRRKRREVPKHVRGTKLPSTEEYDFVDKAWRLDNQNPFVRFALLDSIIDCIRDTRGSFVCGGMTFRSNSIFPLQFMKKSCREILKEFPRSVKFHSKVSDYFARFVTLCFFDIPLADECLNIAYDLNPEYPPTTHRLGIFNRMSKGDLSTSFRWFIKTAEMDPLHFNAFMECVKNWLRCPDEYNVANLIEAKLLTAAACSWSDMEILELLFYKGIGHFTRKEFDKAIESWIPVSAHNPVIFRLSDLDQTCGFYNWNEDLISTDKLRLWLREEKSKEGQSQKRKDVVTLLYNLMLGIVEPARSNLVFNPLCCATIFRHLNFIKS